LPKAVCGEDAINRNQTIALAAAAANLLLVLLFPPFDQYSIASSKVPVFAGFNFILAAPSVSQINTGVLWLETIVVLANAGIAWLLLRDGTAAAPARRKRNFQNGALVITGVNLVLVLLFPPFESVFAVTNAALPNFEGFYFIFSQKPNHTIVTTLLYVEVFFILANGALFWLIFKERRPAHLSAEQMRALSAHWTAKQEK
jgi:cytochrome c-type biogenesis protein CcmH/NrfF